MYSISGRVGTSQTDVDGHMKLISALDFMQDCSLFWIESEPVFFKFMQDNSLALVLQFRQMEVLRLPVYGEPVKATTSIYGCQSFYGYRNTALYGEDGKPCILSWSLGVFSNLETGRMARLPEDMAQRITIDEQLPMHYMDRRIRLPKQPGKAHPPYRVRHNDIDVNRHMNNARYLEAVQELLPSGFEPRHIRIEYKMPAREGELLHPCLLEAEDGYIVRLANEGGKPCTVLEFTQ